jgi:hypothetical protein
LRRPRVEILYFDGCPYHEGTRALIERLAAELRIEPEITLVRVADVEAAVQRRFLGSPTIRVDGRDVEPGAGRRSDFAFSCRVYRSKRGVSAQPDAKWVREALSRAAA